jgi:hypothetical protein
MQNSYLPLYLMTLFMICFFIFIIIILTLIYKKAEKISDNTTKSLNYEMNINNYWKKWCTNNKC